MESTVAKLIVGDRSTKFTRGEIEWRDIGGGIYIYIYRARQNASRLSSSSSSLPPLSRILGVFARSIIDNRHDRYVAEVAKHAYGYAPSAGLDTSLTRAGPPKYLANGDR